MRIAIITINYNNAGATIRLLETLRLNTDRDLTVVAVDNASVPADRARLETFVRSEYPEVELLASQANLGFSGGNNMGMRHAAGQGTDWFVFINNDAQVAPTFVADLKTELSDAKPGILAIPIKEGEHIAYGGRVVWLRSTLPHLFEREPENKRLYAIGAAVAVHRDVFDAVGPWDERYFLYFEDADLSERARKRGYPVRIASKAMIRHTSQTTTRELGAPLLLRYHMRNALLFNFKHAPWWAVLLLPPWSFFVIVKQVFKLIIPQKRTQRDAAYAILHGIDDFYRGRFGIIHDDHRDRMRVH